VVPVRAGRKILVQPNGRGVSPPIFFGDFSMSELSIFVDESVDFVSQTFAIQQLNIKLNLGLHFLKRVVKWYVDKVNRAWGCPI